MAAHPWPCRPPAQRTPECRTTVPRRSVSSSGRGAPSSSLATSAKELMPLSWRTCGGRQCTWAMGKHARNRGGCIHYAPRSCALPAGPPLADATDTTGCGGRLGPHPPPLLARHLLPVSGAQQLGQDAPSLLPCQPCGRLKARTSDGGGGVVERAAGQCRSARRPCVFGGRAKIAIRITQRALEGRVQLAASPGAQSACRPEQRSPRAASGHAGLPSFRVHAAGMQADPSRHTDPSAAAAAADKVLLVQRQDGTPWCSTPGSRGGAGRLAGGCTPAGQGHCSPVVTRQRGRRAGGAGCRRNGSSSHACRGTAPWETASGSRPHDPS